MIAAGCWRGGAAALLAGCASVAAHAGRPLVTEDAPVLADGECSVETYVASYRADETSTVRALSSQLGCGIGRRTQLSIAGARAVSDDGHGDALTLAGKTSMTGPREESTEWSLAYGATALRTTGFETHMDQLYATLAATAPLTATLSTHLNLGWTGAVHPHCNTTRWALALEQAVRDDLHLVAEAFADDRSRWPWLQAGGWVALNRQVSFNGSYGRKTHGGGASALTLGVTIGF